MSALGISAGCLFHVAAAAFFFLAFLPQFTGVHRTAVTTGSRRAALSLSKLARRPSGAGPRELEEGEGFEPPIPFQVQRFSRPPPSTTRPSLRAVLPKNNRAHDLRPRS